MSPAPLAALPPDRRETIHAAIAAAFGPVATGPILPVSGGASGAVVLRLEIRGRCYLVRAEGPAGPLRNPQQYASMRIAAAAGIAPPLHHIDEAARVAVMDFVPPRPLGTYPGGPHALARALGRLLARLQATPAFPPFVDYPDLVARLFAHVRGTGLFAAGLLDPHADRLASIRADLAAAPVARVSSHNDLIPSNILFDGRRLWLVDWESACRNDPLVDVATMLDKLAPSPTLADTLLRAWLGRAPDAALLDRLGQVRALTRLYYAGVMLSGSAAAGWTSGECDLSAPTAAAFHRAIREGRVRPGTTVTRHVLGKMFLASFLSGAEAPGFEAAV